jgi:hypothetical protein
MPNYCENRLTITADKSTIDTLQAAFEKGALLETLRPEPTHEGYAPSGQPCDNGMPEWWNWRIANWGTKWDVGGEHGVCERVSDTEIRMDFDSAWSPPIEALQSRDDIQYVLHYCETGCDFCGTASGDSDGHSDESYSIEDAPPHLVAEFALDEWREAMDDQ